MLACVQELVPVLGVCVAERRVEVYKTSRPDGGDEQLYKLISAERAEKLVGLSSEEEAVLALIEKSGYARVRMCTHVHARARATPAAH
ncbi:hypothetical protein EON67_03735 [archaeon]|nr:MAG: hypothetical protein EON67_03735 [archaeon]